MSRKKRRRDPHAHIDRLVAESGAGERRKARERETAERAAAVAASPGRWLVPAGAGDAGAPIGLAGATGVPLDVIADLLALDPRTHLQGRNGSRLRTIAAAVEVLVSSGATTIGGVPLVDVVVTDDEERVALAPSWDMDALLGGDVGAPSPVDRTIRLAVALMDSARAHHEGARDLVADVGLPGVDRHPMATEIETIAAVAVGDWPLPVVVDPAAVVHRDGWVAVSPFELFLCAARGLLTGTVADVAGSLLAAWLETFGRLDPWEAALRDRVTVDASGILQQAASRAGSDHPDVMGSVVAELVALRHPL